MSEIRAADLVKVNPGAAEVHSSEICATDLVEVNIAASEVDS